MISLLQKANCNCVSTYVPWNWHEPTEGEFDFTGETHPCRNLIGFLDLVKAENLFLIIKPGPFVHNEMKNGGIPTWLTDQHPEVLALGPDGLTSRYQSYPPLSYMHPLTMGYIRKWYDACARILKRYDNIILWQVDNETSYSYTFMDGTGLLNDFHPHLVDKGWYQKFLKKRFKDIGILNRRYGTRYRTFENVEPPRRNPQSDAETLRVFDWIHFKEWLGTEYLKRCCDMLYRLGVKGPFILNAPFHGFFSLWRDLVKSIDNRRYRLFITHCDYPGPVNETSAGAIIARTEFCKSCQSVFHGNNEIQSCNVSQRWGLFETTYELLFKLVAGNGLGMINYYWFCDGENFLDYGEYSHRHEYNAPVSRDLKRRPHYEILRNLNGQVLNHPQWLEYEKVYHVSLGYLHEFHRMSIFRNTLGANIVRQVDDLSNLLALSSISFKVVNLSELGKEDTGVLIVPTPKFMPSRIQKSLLRYANSGNHLILMGRIPEVDEDLNPCTAVMDALKLKEMNMVSRKRGWEEPHRVCIAGIETPVYDNLQVYETGAEELATCDGRCCGFSQEYGEGKITVIGFGLSYFMDVHKEMICTLLGRSYESDLIHWERKKGNRTLHTLLNIYSEPRKIELNGRTIKVAQKTGTFVLSEDDRQVIIR